MSPLLRPGGHEHRIRRIGTDLYEISWTYDVKYGRIRYPRGIRRMTDEAGAQRFAKKWGCKMPAPPHLGMSHD